MSYGGVFPGAMARRSIRNDRRELESDKTDQKRELRLLKREQEKALADREKKDKPKQLRPCDREKKVRDEEKRLKAWQLNLAKDQVEVDRLKEELLGNGKESGSEHAEPMDPGEGIFDGFKISEEEHDDFALGPVPPYQFELDK